MNHFSIHVNHCGSAKAPPQWQLGTNIRIQRLYYIKGGSGFFVGEDGARTPFIPGKIYITPYNLHDKFLNSPDDPIDHIFFDFFTTPPIIASEPLVYDVQPGSSLHQMILLIEQIHTEAGISRRPSSPRQKQLMGQLLKPLLTMLSMIRPIPFSDDASICDTLEYIRQNYASQISVRELATMAGFEVNYFIRRFKDIMGVTPYAYLRSYRLLQAVEQIAGGATVARAASTVGYENASSLSRALASLQKNR